MQRELVERELTSEGPKQGKGNAARRVRARSRSETVNLAETPL